MLPFKTPYLLKKLYPSLLWQMPKSDKPCLYLTFDDGPIPEVTQFVLETLSSFNAKATFFCIGDNIRKHPLEFKKIIEDGHAIGNHTFNHLKGSQHSKEVYLANVKACDEQMMASGKIKTSLFRPPYGRIKIGQRKALLEDKKIVMWDVLTQDYDNDISQEICLQKTVNSCADGSIVLFHDSIKANKNMSYTLPKLLAHFSEKGFDFRTIPF